MKTAFRKADSSTTLPSESSSFSHSSTPNGFFRSLTKIGLSMVLKSSLFDVSRNVSEAFVPNFESGPIYDLGNTNESAINIDEVEFR